MLFAAQQALPMVLCLVVGGIILRKFNYEKDYHLEIREETRYVKFSKHMGNKNQFLHTQLLLESIGSPCQDDAKSSSWAVVVW